MRSKSKLLYELNDKPPFLLSLFLAIQHVLLYLPGTVILPLIVANVLGLTPIEKERIVFASVLISGVSSFIQVYKFKRIGSGHVLFMGSGGSFLSASIMAGLSGGFGLIAAMTILSAPLEIIFSYFMRYVRKIITPAMGGIVMILISVSLLPLLMEMWTGSPNSPDYCSSQNLITGLVTISVIILFSFLGTAHLQIWSPLFGIIAGIITATILGITDYSDLANHALIGIPKAGWILPDFHLKLSHIPIFISFLFATLASTIETIGDSITIQDTSVNNLRKVNYEVVQGSLYADGISNILAGLMGTMANTTYSGNIAIVKLTKVASRKIGIYASIIIALLAFFPKFISCLTLIPGPVMGASSVMFMGLLFSSGIKLIASSEIDYETGIIIGISLTVGIISTFKLFFPALITETYKPFIDNGVATGGLTAIILNILTKLKSVKKYKVRVSYNVNDFPILQKAISKVKKEFDITSKQFYNLQLTCEEIFGYICSSNPDQKGTIQFKFTKENEFVRVLVEDKSKINDIDLVNNKDVQPQSREFGLLVVNKIAKEVEHIIIDGHNAISFII
jgi:NCS2 family nucleobase:cation symporter-2/xanthine permease XanP